MKRTTNYALPTWEKSDFIQMSDFNDLTQKTDAALKANAGQSNAVSIACDFYPVVLLVAPLDDSPVKNPRIMVRGRTSGTIRPEGGSNFNLTVVWKDAGVSWYNATATNANQQLNNDESYCYVVLGYDKVKESE